MSTTVKIAGGGRVTLTDKDYLSSGGEAEVYVKGKTAYKIYHDPSRAISQEQFDELSVLKGMKNIVIPKKLIYPENDQLGPIGISMKFIPDTQPLIKLFTNSFKRKNSVEASDINHLITEMQKIVEYVHQRDVLVVDMNELNILVSNDFKDLFFIDTDSYQTSSFPASAIMASIRDPLVQRNQWNNGSDWFSFAVLAFQMWIGIHPYKGVHPNYKRKDWLQRMTDGVSIFDPNASLPKMCNDLSLIPPSHYQWMQAVFQNGERSKPPAMGEISIVLNTITNIIETSESFDIDQVFEAVNDIIDVYDVMGVKYIISQDGVYKGGAKLPLDVSSTNKVLLSSGTGLAPVLSKIEDELLTFHNVNGLEFARIGASDIMARNGVIYSVFEGDCYEHTFSTRNGKDMHDFRMVCSVMPNSVKVFEGVLFQTMMKKQFAVIPYEKGACAITAVKELDGSRIIDAKCERNICIVLAEKEGQYNRHVLTFEKDFNSYSWRVDENVSATEINFTVLPNGIAVLATDTDVEIFKGDMLKKIDNSPFTADNKLFNIGGSVHYIDEKKIFKASIKK